MNNPTDIIESVSRPLPMTDALQLLKERILRDSQRGDIPDGKQLRTFSAEVTDTDALLWLHGQPVYPKLYWANREKDDIVAGVGEADAIRHDKTGPNSESFELLQREISKKDPSARYFGGFCFNNQQKQDPQWRSFRSFTFILPLVSLESGNGKTVLVCNLLLDPEKEREEQYSPLLETLDKLVQAPDDDSLVPEASSVSFRPDERHWMQTCDIVLQRFREGFMGKIILARQTVLDFPDPFPPSLFMLRHPFPESSTYRYYFEPEPNTAFFSFTPERLYRRERDQLFTEALAGTCSRETIGEGGIDACQQLLNSEKDVREHRFVKDTIAKELEPICSEIDMEEKVRALQLNRLVHLYTQCHATLQPGSESDNAVLKCLHPTPAVGGVPRRKALEQIIHLEPFSRGWYAGPVGWISRNAAEFAVGIRSGLADDNRVYLYSGAGLVSGSDPASEWREVDQKISDILAITRRTD